MAKSRDREMIEAAYRDELKNLFHTFFLNVVGNSEGAEQSFSVGLKALRAVRIVALKKVDEEDHHG
jgi:hypothetical protein